MGIYITTMLNKIDERKQQDKKYKCNEKLKIKQLKKSLNKIKTEIE